MPLHLSLRCAQEGQLPALTANEEAFAHTYWPLGMLAASVPMRFRTQLLCPDDNAALLDTLDDRFVAQTETIAENARVINRGPRSPVRKLWRTPEIPAYILSFFGLPGDYVRPFVRTVFNWVDLPKRRPIDLHVPLLPVRDNAPEESESEPYHPSYTDDTPPPSPPQTLRQHWRTL